MADHREQIGQSILDLCQGIPSEQALLGQIDALATAIGALHQLSGDSIDEAEDVAGRVSGMLIQHIRTNWGDYQVEGGSN